MPHHRQHILYISPPDVGQSVIAQSLERQFPEHTITTVASAAEARPLIKEHSYAAIVVGDLTHEKDCPPIPQPMVEDILARLREPRKRTSRQSLGELLSKEPAKLSPVTSKFIDEYGPLAVTRKLLTDLRLGKCGLRNKHTPFVVYSHGVHFEEPNTRIFSGRNATLIDYSKTPPREAGEVLKELLATQQAKTGRAHAGL